LQAFCLFYLNAPEGCPHGTHTSRTAYTRGTLHSREHTQPHRNTNQHIVRVIPRAKALTHTPQPRHRRSSHRHLILSSCGPVSCKNKKISLLSVSCAGRQKKLLLRDFWFFSGGSKPRLSCAHYPPARCTTRHAPEGILHFLFQFYPPHPTQSRQDARNPSSWASIGGKYTNTNGKISKQERVGVGWCACPISLQLGRAFTGQGFFSSFGALR